MDRRLLGVVLIALVVSSAAFFSFVGENVEEPIEILKDEWNLPMGVDGFRIPGEEGRYAYSLGLVVRSPIRRLDLVFTCLENRSSSLPELVNASELGLWEAFMNLSQIGPLASTIDLYPYVEERVIRPEVALEAGNFNYRGVVYDMTDPEVSTAPGPVPRTLQTVHLLMRNEEGPTSYYRGVRDFFIDRNRTIIDIMVQFNENLTRFAQRTSEQGESVPIERAPDVGKLRFDDLRTDDQIFVSIAINPAMVPTRKSLLQLVMIFVDGEHHSALSHFLTSEGG
jgi:hypothetical protein